MDEVAKELQRLRDQRASSQASERAANEESRLSEERLLRTLKDLIAPYASRIIAEVRPHVETESSTGLFMGGWRFKVTRKCWVISPSAELGLTADRKLVSVSTFAPKLHIDNERRAMSKFLLDYNYPGRCVVRGEYTLPHFSPDLTKYDSHDYPRQRWGWIDGQPSFGNSGSYITAPGMIAACLLGVSLST